MRRKLREWLIQLLRENIAVNVSDCVHRAKQEEMERESQRRWLPSTLRSKGYAVQSCDHTTFNYDWHERNSDNCAWDELLDKIAALWPEKVYCIPVNEVPKELLDRAWERNVKVWVGKPYNGGGDILVAAQKCES